MILLMSFNFIVFAFLGLIWKGSTWLNVFLKFTLLAAMVGNGFYLAQSLGYIIKAV